MAVLTYNEILDINNYLQSGKPLPEKYRFLLFEDKREVELVWNGKTSDVCNIVISMNIEIGDEQFTKAPGILEGIAYRDIMKKTA